MIKLCVVLPRVISNHRKFLSWLLLIFILFSMLPESIHTVDDGPKMWTVAKACVSVGDNGLC